MNNALLIRRRGMMMAGGGTPLPYDAEIEYLQNRPYTQTSNAPCIRLNYTPKNYTGLKFRVVSADTTLFRLGCYMVGTNDGTQYFSIYHEVNAGNQQKNIFYIATEQISSPQTARINDCTYLANYLNDRLFVRNNEVIGNIVSDYVGVSNYFGLFCQIPSTGVIPTKTNNVYGQNHFYCKFYYLQITEYSDIVVDLIPVRVGTVGYMYDRVSGQLFGNSGTGDFILGPDIQ